MNDLKVALKKVWGYWWGKVVLGVMGVAVVAWGLAVVDRKATGEQVAKIHATKLTMDDVVGKNLPPDPGTEADKTIAGIDANKNGIRDDVELAIFKEYPNSAKTRAVLLQYALALQMEMVQLVVNKDTVTAVAEEASRGHYCIGEITSRVDMKKFIEIGDRLHGFVENRQLNTEARKKAQHDFYEGKLRSYSTTLGDSCDLDVSKL